MCFSCFPNRAYNSPNGDNPITIAGIQYILDDTGKTTGVIIPIELWREIESERETAYLLKSEAMKKRLLEAKERAQGIPYEVAREKLGIW